MKVIKLLLTILLYFVFAALWYLIFTLSYDGYKLGFLTCFEDFYGYWSVWAGVIVAVTVCLSPVYLRKFIKKEYFVVITSLVLSVVFVFIAIGTLYITEKQFEDFTPERWHQYPRQRGVMVDDMRSSNHNVIGMSQGEVIKTLGEPYRVTDGGIFEYSYEYGYIIIYLNAGKVSSIDITRDTGKIN